MQYLQINLDDSGNLHPNANTDYFIYAGYIFLSRIEVDNAKRNYRSLARKISEARGLSEVKASNLLKYPNDKRKLYAIMKKYYSFHVVIDRKKLYQYILEQKKSICRYKDYALKRAVKKIIQELISSGLLTAEEDIKIILNMDEQATASDGYYSLKESIYEELVEEIYNFNYGSFFEPILHGKVKIAVNYFDSKKNYLIQASDILANRIWSSYEKDKVEWRIREKHIELSLP